MGPSLARLAAGPVAIIECRQNIPCNPCVDACMRGAIKPFSDINDCPELDVSRCNGCGACLAHCPGLAIFVADYSYSPTQALIKIPYEFSPVPQPGDVVEALDRAGRTVGEAEVIKIQEYKNKTRVLALAVPRELGMEVRHIRRREEYTNE
ncbi:MAG: 4Fe-4S binding protein [Negativicutes bacterium]|nr:4Fe-4S binding protein [Negativicutes bacterium]